MQSLHFIVNVLIIFSIVSALQNEVKEQETIAKGEKRVRRAGYTYVYRYNNHYGVKKCIPPGAPKHGYSYFQSTNVGSVVVHTCKPGYKLVGAKVRVCKHTGYWKPHLPKCTSSTCKDPGTLLNGYRFLSSTTVKSIVKYKCKPGYYLIGSSYQVCLANGKWSGVFPKCLGSGCRQLSNPANGRVEISNRNIGGVATYFCNSGFNLVGAKTRVCQSGGEWSGTAPNCQESSCGNLANPQNGKVTIGSTNVGATARYSCNSGFILVGNRIRTCQNNKKWSGTAPVCKPLSCGHLDSPKDGKVIISGTTPGSVATYSCNPGFILVGVFKRTCQINGKWSGNAPTCKPINCENLSPPSNGFIIFSSSSPETQRPGDKATYRCSKGFRLVGGSRVRVCQQDGSYSGQTPRCQSISCGNLRDPPNGQVKMTGSFVGDKATYTCNRGFILDGNQLRTCQSTGSWTGQEPICRPIDCGDLSNPQNGRVIVTTTRLGGIAKYSCNDGFKLVGNVVRRCLASGQWSNEAPICKANNCGRLLNHQNGHVRLSGTTTGSTATYICNRGFQLVGQRQRICQQNTQWSGQVPRCESVSCEVLQDPENGRVTVLGTLPGSVAQYSCNAGFRLVGLKTRVCSQDGSFSGQAPTCKSVLCETLENPANGQVNVNGRRPGDEATYQCNAGFTLVGQKTRVCQNDGTFSGQAPVCKPIFCEPLQDPENGRVTVSNNQPGAIATYICNPGFRLIGQSSRVCQNDGTFTGQAPVCRFIDCGPLSDIRNGRVEFSSTTFGSVANYFCDSGYNLVGNRQRTCQRSGQWSGEEPRCKIIDCGPLPAPQNGNVDFSSTTFLSKASYSCQNGFDLVGTRTRVCQANRQWSNDAPVCQSINCERLNHPDNGIVVVNGNTIGAVATYHCNPGFLLVGLDQRICQEDGTYSGVAPSCRVIDCGPLENPKNGIVKFGGTIIGSRATYACNKGFTLMGNSNRICQPSGDWSGQEPTCSIIQCQELLPPANGDISFSSTDFGAIATYSCKFGFILVGVKTRTCQINGEWSETSPFCRSIDCGPLDFPANGIVTLDSTTVGSRAFYRCNPGFKLIGQEQRTCQENGEWSGTKPECQSNDCGQLQEPEYGKVTITGTTTGSVATYSCNKGFKLTGTVNRICLATGQWSRTAPTCQPEDCGGLDNPANGKVDVTGTAFWDTATYSCNPGYQLVGESVRTCQDNAQWSGVAPICQSVDCGFLDSPENGRVSFTGTTINSVATYSCFPGYQLVGKATRTCQRNGQWSGLAPFCKAVDCGTLQDPKNGKVILTGTEVFSTANYQCDKGFGLVGISTRVCQPDGTWSGSAPVCEPSDCGELDPPHNGVVSTSGTKYWDTATYSCISGYSLIGESSRTCLDTGVWSGKAPVCVAVDCGKLNPPQYGQVDFQSTSFQSRAIYSCFNGFQLIGERTRICQADGQWSGEAPICQSVICGNIFAPENGQLHVSQGNLVDSIATYNCNPGYQLQGNAERTCQSNGEWTGVDPTCIAVDCGNLPDIIYGQVSLSGTTVGSIATYSCDAGFKLVPGPSTRECLPNGIWSGVEPTCEPGGCGPLRSPLNGDVTLTGTDVGDTATYKCNSGFTLEGDRFRVCESSGDWSGQDPSCIALDCGPLQDPVNGHVDVKGTTVSSTATYTCDSGFVLIGNSQRECLPSGQWSGQDPTCKAVDCGPLKQPENGDVRISSTTFGSSARYSCFPGYNLIGFSLRVCQLDGTWSGQEPTCEAGQCPNLPNPSNGIVTLSGRTLGSIATYKCNDGYELIGEDKRTCQSDATWSGREPSCKIVDCGPLFAPDNGRVEFSTTFYGSVATYSCSIDFKLIGTASRTCQKNGLWSSNTPLCETTVRDCGQLQNPRNGEVLLSGTRSGDTATYTCFVGFSIVGVDIRFCRDDGTWSDKEPQCRPVDCGPLESPENGNIRFIGNGFGSIARYNCFPGYKLIGDVSRTCKSDGFWSGAAPVCISDSSTSPPPTPPSQICGDPGTPPNGVKIGSDYSVGSVVYYECEPGFKLVGPKSRLCRFDGHWSEDLPTCVGDGQCVGNDKTEDECGQVCTCENGYLVNCCRLRHDFASLDDKEKENYINAVTTVATDPVYKIKYEALLEKYKASFDTVAQGTIPDTSQFLVWNRFFLLEYENLLREIDCHITIPYYDWTVFHTNPYIHPIWDDEKGFGKSSNENDKCVTTGPFNYNNYHLIPSAGGGCLKREYDNRKFPSRALIERDVLTRPASEFKHFHQSLQLFIHINVRCFVGGTMCTPDAANDPVFILHLSMIDYIYSRWQGFDEQRLKARYYEDNSALALAEGFTATQFHDNSDLPNGVAICYAEPRIKNHVPPSLYFLAQSFRESSNSGNIYMTCISQEKFDKIGQHFSDEDKEFFRKKCDVF